MNGYDAAVEIMTGNWFPEKISDPSYVITRYPKITEKGPKIEYIDPILWKALHVEDIGALSEEMQKKVLTVRDIMGITPQRSFLEGISKIVSPSFPEKKNNEGVQRTSSDLPGIAELFKKIIVPSLS